jgi:hypothetical protein
MIPSPYRFEPDFTDMEFAKLGVLAMRWAHIEHILGNCLKTILRLSEEEAVVIVFPMSGDQRISRIAELAKINPLSDLARAPFEELRPVMRGLQYVRNNVIHSIALEDDNEGHVFHLRSKMRSLTKAQVFSTEELTNYAGHLVIAFRYALGWGPGALSYTCPDRPEIPEFLKSIIAF